MWDDRVLQFTRELVLVERELSDRLDHPANRATKDHLNPCIRDRVQYEAAPI